MSGNIKTYLKGVGTGYISMLLANVIALFLTPFSLHYLTREEYAIFMIANDIIIWLGLVQLGTGTTLNAKASHLIGSGDTRELSTVASTAFTIQTVASVIIVIIGVVLSFNLQNWFKSQHEIEQVKYVFQILVLGASLTILSEVFSALLIASKQVHVDNSINMILLLMRTALTVIFLIAGLKIMGLALANIISTVIAGIIAYIRAKKVLPDVKISFRLAKRQYVKYIISTGWWFTLGGFAGILILSLDRLMIAKFVSLALVTNFIITQKLYFIADKLLSQVFNVSRPYIGQMVGKKNYQEVKSTYDFSIITAVLVSSIVATLIFMINRWFIGLWVGPKFYMGNEMNLFLALNFVLQICVLPNRVLLAVTFFKIRVHALLRVFEGLANLGLSILLVRIIKAEGVILGSILATIPLSTIFMNYLSNSYFKSFQIEPNRRIYYSYLFLLMPIGMFYIFQINSPYLKLGIGIPIFILSASVSILYVWKLVLKESQKVFVKVYYDKFYKKILS